MTASSVDSMVATLASIVGERGVVSRPNELLVYQADALPTHKSEPKLAVFPRTKDELIAIVRALAAAGRPFVPRGAGTGLSSGALASGDAVIIGLNRLNRIIAIDPVDRLAKVEPGVVNVALTRAAAPHGLHYAPDPSSQSACTIGGNVAENAGGPHCLKYGVTLNHVVQLDVVLPDGTTARLGNADGEDSGYDLLGAFVGSEGCFGIAYEITVKLTPNPQAVRTLLADFPSIDDGARAVSAIVASGVVPAALEMMDGPTIRAVEDSVYAAGYPRDAGAVLLIELDGLEAGLDSDASAVEKICRDAGARGVRSASDPAERAKLWQGRKKAFGALGRLGSALMVQDAVIPRTKLPEIMRIVQDVGARHRLTICNMFHAGDGNLHPNVAYNGDDPDEVARVDTAMREIMAACIAVGGSITGEHGVGLDKLGYMDQIFSPESLEAQCRLRDVFDPARRANPAKVLPVRSCREWTMAPASRA